VHAINSSSSSRRRRKMTHVKNGWIIMRSSALETTDIVYSLMQRRKSV